MEANKLSEISTEQSEDICKKANAILFGNRRQNGWAHNRKLSSQAVKIPL